MIEDVKKLFGDEIAEKIGSKIWGLDSEGEFCKAYRPTGQPGLWFTPGAVQHSRFFSKHMVRNRGIIKPTIELTLFQALQILAEELGLKTAYVSDDMCSKVR